MTSPSERLSLYRDIRITIKDGQWINVFYSTEADCPACGFDELSQSAVLVNCATCQGRGRISTYFQSQLLGKATWRSRPDMTFSVGGEVVYGDLVIIADKRDKAIYEKIEQDNEGYLQLDGRTLRPMMIHTPVGSNEIMVMCQLVNKEVLRS